MENISDVKLCALDKSIYVKPVRMHFLQDGIKKNWDMVKCHDSIAILIFNLTRKVLVFVKQFRPAVYLSRSAFDKSSDTIDSEKNPGSLGITIELCAGIVDKDKTLIEIAKEEILEECGYNVPEEKIYRVTSYRSNVGHSSPLQTLFYAEVTDAMRVSSGGGNKSEGEFIDVIDMTIAEAKAVAEDESIAKPVSMLYGLSWFFSEKKSTYLN